MRHIDLIKRNSVIQKKYDSKVKMGVGHEYIMFLVQIHGFIEENDKT
jgi:hypothetical protein